MKLKKLMLGTLLLTSAAMANAEIIIGDWKSEGDGLLRLDTNSGLEWIDTELTYKRSISEIQETFGEGGEFEGFRVADQYDVEGMVASLFGYTEPEDFLTYNGLYENENGTFNTFTTERAGVDIENSDGKILSEIFESYFSTGLVEDFHSNREEEVFLYDRFLYLSNGFDINLDDTENTDVLTLGLYVKQSVDGTYTYKDEAQLYINNVNGTLLSAYASIFLVSDDLVSYSSLNDSSYLKAKEGSIANVSAPLSFISLLSFIGLGFIRKKFK